ncbi:hypothetical protein LOTGIDRAFT_235608 [Lottia gigantea]|uniref:CUB domain-containing protein n=1 Tax=Lottia gigantea TaxID=225164 RepID=V3ZTW7_LOTGI|nr:hypothetical protein LOTGIDRAFT_235608 [Lottia gigantea]ESO86010.1 hypothetical protein LOTGIDRAFT_235608 [Lottia gigantea]
MNHLIGFILFFNLAATGCYGCKSHVRLAAAKIANYVSSKGLENCTWLIIASSPDQVVRIDFEDVNIREDCSLSGISIYDGSSFNTKRLGISCEDAQPAYESTGRYMLLHIKTNNSAGGFMAKYYMFSKTQSSSDGVTIVGGIIGGLILLSLATTIVCTLKNHNAIPTIMGKKEYPVARQKVDPVQPASTLPKVSLVTPSANYLEPLNYTALEDPPSVDLITPISFTTPPSLQIPPPVDFITPVNYPSALQSTCIGKANRCVPGHPFDEEDNQGTSYADNSHFTSTKSILSPGGYIATESSSFENFE